MKIDNTWLFERGNLHDARITGVRVDKNRLEIDIDDEWVNERGLSRPEDQMEPITLCFTNGVASGPLGSSDGNPWIGELLLQPDGSFLFSFTNRDSVSVRATAAEARPIAAGSIV